MAKKRAMAIQQKVFVLKTTGGKTQGLDELNAHLGRGWQVVQIAPMGGAGAGASPSKMVLHLGAVVVVERSASARAEAVEKAEEQADEIIEEVVEGNGKGVDGENGSGVNG